VSERRCPSCGGLVGPDAEWCGQCFARLDESGPPEEVQPAPVAVAPEDLPPTPRTRPTEAISSTLGESGIRVEGDRVVWQCPRCGTENPIEASSCTACGAPFGRLFKDEVERPVVPPGRALRLSLLFPGLGHAAVGKPAEGVARAVVFGYAAATVVAILVMRGGSGLGPFMALFLLCAIAAAAFYVLAAVDAARAAGGDPPILSSRGLLYGAVGLVLVTVTVLVITGIRASRGA
jgi:ribosomal protein L40E